VVMLGKKMLDNVNAFVAYNKSILDLAQNLNITTEETSRIIQMADDFSVSQDKVTNSLQFALKNGFAPSIETLATMSDRYLEIQDPLLRAEELSKVFGKSWDDLTPILKRGGDAIRAAAAGIDDSLIVTQKSADLSEEWRIQLDNLGDSVTGLTNNLSLELLPALIKFIKYSNDLVTEYAQEVKLGKMVDDAVKHNIMTQAEANKLYNKTVWVTKDYNGVLEDLKGQIDAVTDTESIATIAMQRAEEERLKEIGTLGDIRAKLSDFDAAAAVHLEYYQRLPGYIAPAKKSIEEITASNKKYFDGINLGLDSTIQNWLDKFEWIKGGGLILQAEMDGYIKKIEDGSATWGEMEPAIEAVSVKTQALNVELGKITADEAAQNIKDTLGVSLSDAYAILAAIRKDANFDIQSYVTVNYKYTGTPQTGSQGGRYGGETNDDYETGGSFTVPEGFPHDSYRVGLTSGEYVTVKPAMASSTVNTHNYHNNSTVNMGGVNVTNGMSMSQLEAMINRAVSRGLSQ